MCKRLITLLMPVLLALLSLTLPGCGATTSVPVYKYRIVREFPHSRDSFTEGLVLDGGFFYEGTGLYDRSKLMKIEPSSGQVVMGHSLEPRYFGEGVTVLNGKVFQLTYQNKIGFVYDQGSFSQERTFAYPTQGWGLTNDGASLIMSDGSAVLRFLDPETLEMERSVTVEDFTGPISNLNELEYVNGEIYANVWKENYIARISPEDGAVTAWIDLTGLNPYSGSYRDEYVLNGIACDADSGRLIVTGKCWPALYEIELYR
jgi:glutamine cyclotransferase